MMARLDLLVAQRAIWESGLSATQKVTLLAILDHWSRKSEAPFPSLARLARWTSLDRRTLIRALAGLEAGGWLAVRRASGRANAYTFTDRCQAITSDTRSPVTVDHPTSVTGSPPPVSQDHGTSVIGSPEGTKEGTKDKEPREGTHANEVLAVFSFWQADTGKTETKLDQKRRTRIKARLAEGFTVDEIQAAIRNRRNDPWLMGTDPKSKRAFDGIETLLRDAAQVERLRDLTAPPRCGRPAVQGGTFDEAGAKARATAWMAGREEARH